MASNQVCSRCGVELAESTPHGFCPSCLLREGLEPEVRDQKSEASPGAIANGPTNADAIRHRPSAICTRFGDYELLEEIARGGMGVVYKARQVSLNRTVAVKLIRAGPFASKEFVHRFRVEASAAAVLQHPNIVAVHEVGVHEGLHFFSMDYVAGQNLAEIVRDGPLRPSRAARYVQKIAEAIQYAHDSGILHRDLKPSNVLIDAQDQPRITDFGLAKFVVPPLGGKGAAEPAKTGTTYDAAVTLTGEVIGTPGYMPPEQASGRRGAVQAWSDVYSLGAILYHLLTGRPPFAAGSLEETLDQMLHQDPVSVRLLNPAVPRDLDTICRKCLEKEPAKRYATAQLLADELGRFLKQEPILARPLSTVGKAGRWCRRNPRLASVTSLAFLSLVIGLAGVTWEWRQTERQRLRAEAGELLARQNVYAADMKLAQLALADNNVRLAKTLLNKHRPELVVPASAGSTQMSSSERSDRLKAGLQTDLRHWEWRYLWQLCQGDESEVLHQYSAPITALAVSKNEKVLAVQTGGQVALWNLTTRLPIPGPTKAANKILALSPSGNLLAYDGRDARGKPAVHIWDVPAGKLRTTISLEAPAKSLAFSPDEKLLATFDQRGTNAVFELASNQTLDSLGLAPMRRGGAGVVVFSPDGSRVAIGGDYGEIQIRNWRSRTNERIPTGTGDGITALAFSPTNELIAAGFAFTNENIGLWDARTGEARGQLNAHSRVVRALAFSPDGRFLAAPCDGETIRVWSVSDQVERRCLREYRGGANSVAFLPDSRTLLSGGKDGAIRLWDISGSSQAPGHTNFAISYGFPDRGIVEVQGFTRGALDPRVVCRYGFTFTTNGQSLLAPDKDGFIDVWSIHPVQRTERLTELGSNNWDVALSPDGRWLAVGDTAQKVTVWDWTTRQAVMNFALPFDYYGRLRFSRSSKFLLGDVVTHAEGRNWRIWQTCDWEEVTLQAFPPEGPSSVDLSPDDRLLAAGYANGAVTLSRFPSRQREATFTNHSGGVAAVLFSRDGQTLATSVGIWDVSARRELGPFPEYRGGWGGAFSSDGRRLVTGHDGGKDPVKVWDMATHRELIALQAQGQYFGGFSFSADGNTLIASSLDGLVHLWRAPSFAEIEAAERQQRKSP